MTVVWLDGACCVVVVTAASSLSSLLLLPEDSDDDGEEDEEEGSAIMGLEARISSWFRSKSSRDSSRSSTLKAMLCADVPGAPPGSHFFPLPVVNSTLG